MINASTSPRACLESIRELHFILEKKNKQSKTKSYTQWIHKQLICSYTSKSIERKRDVFE